MHLPLRRCLRLLLAGTTLLTAPAWAQTGGPSGPDFSGAYAKIFGQQTAFAATLEIQAGEGKEAMKMQGAFRFDHGNTRMELDLTKMQGPDLDPDAIQQMQQMGMDKIITITRAEEKMSYLVYPGLKAAVATPIADKTEGKPVDPNAYTIQSTELGKEKVDGRPCVKTKLQVTDPEGRTHTVIAWQATDLDKFPVKLQMPQQGQLFTIYFRNLKPGAQPAEAFRMPEGYKSYASVQDLMQKAMMERMQQMMLQGRGPGGEE